MTKIIWKHMKRIFITLGFHSYKKNIHLRLLSMIGFSVMLEFGITLSVNHHCKCLDIWKWGHYLREFGDETLLKSEVSAILSSSAPRDHISMACLEGKKNHKKESKPVMHWASQGLIFKFQLLPWTLCWWGHFELPTTFLCTFVPLFNSSFSWGN